VTAVRCESVTKIYRNGVIANDSIDLSVKKGIIFTILGPNGAGKTTLLRQIYTELLPTKGRIEVFSVDVVERPMEVRKLIGVVPQAAQPIPDLRVEEHVKYFAILRGADEPDAAVSYALDTMDLNEHRDRLVMELSGGLKQRVLVATAIATRPDLIILDEPTVGMDPMTRRRFWRKMEELKREGRTILLTTHYVEEAETVSDEVAVIHKGRILCHGRPEDFKSLLPVRAYVIIKGKEIEESLFSSYGDVIYHDGYLLKLGLAEMDLDLLGEIRRVALDKGFTFSFKEASLEDAYVRMIGGEAVEEAH